LHLQQLPPPAKPRQQRKLRAAQWALLPSAPLLVSLQQVLLLLAAVVVWAG
jgi:hypothetical protein